MNQNQIRVFENTDFGSVRVTKVNGEPYFIGKDVAKVLGYTNPQKAIRDHVDEEDRTVNESFTVNGTAPLLINESGVYALIFGSKLPKAKEFKHWVTAEVLPSIRKTGSYGKNLSPHLQYLIILETEQKAMRQDIDDIAQRVAELEVKPETPKLKKKPRTEAKQWSERETDYLRKAYALGQTDVEIAADLGRTVCSIQDKRSKLELVAFSTRRWTKAEDKKLKRLLDKGLSYREAGKILGRSASGVYSRLAKLRKKA